MWGLGSFSLSAPSLASLGGHKHPASQRGHWKGLSFCHLLLCMNPLGRRTALTIVRFCWVKLKVLMGSGGRWAWGGNDTSIFYTHKNTICAKSP